MPDKKRLQNAFWGPFIVDVESVSQYLMDQWREDAEEKSVNLNTTLSAALNKAPWQMVDAACLASGLSPKGPRTHKGKALVQWMTDPDHLAQLLAGLAPQGRAILRQTLAAGGWFKLDELTRAFGSQDGDGIFWNERPP